MVPAELYMGRAMAASERGEPIQGDFFGLLA
jgi:hypothetical protein